MTDTTITTPAFTVDDLTATVDRHLAAYGDPDVDRRRAAIALAWHPEGRLVDPPIEGTGHAGIDEVAAAVQRLYPGHTFRRSTAVDAHHEFARYGWELVAPDGTVAGHGVDVVRVTGDGRLAGVVGFLGEPGPLAG
jgi:hypothetical protein